MFQNNLIYLWPQYSRDFAPAIWNPDRKKEKYLEDEPYFTGKSWPNLSKDPERRSGGRSSHVISGQDKGSREIERAIQNILREAKNPLTIE